MTSIIETIGVTLTLLCCWFHTEGNSLIYGHSSNSEVILQKLVSVTSDILISTFICLLLSWTMWRDAMCDVSLRQWRWQASIYWWVESSQTDLTTWFSSEWHGGASTPPLQVITNKNISLRQIVNKEKDYRTILYTLYKDCRY